MVKIIRTNIDYVPTVVSVPPFGLQPRSHSNSQLLQTEFAVAAITDLLTLSFVKENLPARLVSNLAKTMLTDLSIRGTSRTVSELLGRSVFENDCIVSVILEFFHKPYLAGVNKTCRDIVKFEVAALMSGLCTTIFPMPSLEHEITYIQGSEFLSLAARWFPFLPNKMIPTETLFNTLVRHYMQVISYMVGDGPKGFVEMVFQVMRHELSVLQRRIANWTRMHIPAPALGESLQ